MYQKLVEIPNGYCVPYGAQMICRQNASYVVHYDNGKVKRYLKLAGAKTAIEVYDKKWRR